MEARRPRQEGLPLGVSYKANKGSKDGTRMGDTGRRKNFMIIKPRTQDNDPAAVSSPVKLTM